MIDEHKIDINVPSNFVFFYDHPYTSLHGKPEKKKKTIIAHQILHIKGYDST